MTTLPTPGMQQFFDRALEKDKRIRWFLKQPKYRQHFEDRVKRGRGNACDLWIGHVDAQGYGIWSPHLNGKQYHFKAHRAELIRKGTRFGPKIVSRHSCRNKNCIKHVKPGPVVDNIRDKIRDGTIVLPNTVGSSNGYAKLTETKVRCIRWLHEKDPDLFTREELAQVFGVSRHTIGNAVRKDTWKHI